MTKPTIQELEKGEIKMGDVIQTYRRWIVDLNTKHHYDSVSAMVLEEGKDFGCTGSECSKLKWKHGERFVCGHVRALKNFLQLG